MRSGVLLLLIAGLLGFGMWTEFLQILYASYSPVSYFRRREKCAECQPTWYPAVVYWKNILKICSITCFVCFAYVICLWWFAVPGVCFILGLCCTGSRASVVLRTWQPHCSNQCHHFRTFLSVSCLVVIVTWFRNVYLIRHKLALCDGLGVPTCLFKTCTLYNEVNKKSGSLKNVTFLYICFHMIFIFTLTKKVYMFIFFTLR